jgi:CubicO group peptidase (beta-lactamase class C family)
MPNHGLGATLAVALLASACATPPIADRSSTPLPRASLASVGLEEAPWTEAVEALTRQRLPVDTLTVTVAGRIVAEHARPPHDSRTLHDLRSSTKSITALLVGAALDRGLLASLDEPVRAFFPEQRPPDSWDAFDAMTIEDLLTMRSGLDCDDWDTRSRGNEERMYRTGDWLGFFFALPALEAPGERFSYCTAGVVVLGEIVARVAERPLPEVADAWLLAPLGIREARFAEAPRGVTDAGGHLELSAESLTKIALLALAEGRWEGEAVISASFVDAMLTPHTTVHPAGGPRYGYLFWLEPVEDGVVRSFQTRGNGGQFAIALPELDAVVTFTGHAYNDDARQAAFFELTARRLIPWLETAR